MTKENAIIIETLDSLGTGIRIISLTDFNKMPVRYLKGAEYPNVPRVGDMIQKIENNPWTLEVGYNTHTYELATVIGKQGNDLLVYGNKHVGERIIRNYSSAVAQNNPLAVFDIQRGDELLLNECPRDTFTIIYNITQEKLKYYAHNRTK